MTYEFVYRLVKSYFVKFISYRTYTDISLVYLLGGGVEGADWAAAPRNKNCTREKLLGCFVRMLHGIYSHLRRVYVLYVILISPPRHDKTL